MKKNMRFKTIIWAFRLAWKIDKRMLIVWYGLSGLLAVLPAVALHFYREIVALLSEQVAYQNVAFTQVSGLLLAFGIVTVLTGLSKRINTQFVYMVMYDAYYLGMEQYMMDQAQTLDLIQLQQSETASEYTWCVRRGGSLNDLMSGACLLWSKGIGTVSLLVTALSMSMVAFGITVIYIIAALVVELKFMDKLRIDAPNHKEDVLLTDYYEKIPRSVETAKEIRIFDSEKEVIEQWEKAYEGIERFEQKYAWNKALHVGAAQIGYYLFFGALLGFAAYEVAMGAMTPSVFLTLYTLGNQLSTAVGDLSNGAIKADYGLFALERQMTFFENAKRVGDGQDEDKADTPLDPEVCYEAKNLCFYYREDKPILKDLSFEIRRGETIALVGMNGAGKSTLIKILLGLFVPSSGEIKLFGRPFHEYKSNFLAKKVGTFFQDFTLWHLQVRENIGVGDVKNIANNEKIMKAASAGGADKVLKKLPKGVDTLLLKYVDKSGTNLSGGEGQRVAVSRAHMSEKDILIFDEPASKLDPIAEVEQFDQIKRHIKGRTAILISHRIGFARLADRIFVLDKGRLVQCGSHEELIAKEGLYRQMFNEQAAWYQVQSAKKEVAANE